MAKVFLSASFPTGSRGIEVAPYSTEDIASAASSIIEAVLRTGADLVFGGHPTITPLVLQTADLLAAGGQVEMWQSEWFADLVTSESRRLVDVGGARLRRTPRGGDLAGSLLTMRRAMLAEPLSAAFFVGGMGGTQEELEVLRDLHPRAAVFLVARPGGMAARLAERLDGAALPAPSGRLEVLTGRSYGVLTLTALESVGLRLRDRGEA